MKSSVEYLEAARTEEVARQLRTEGYDVVIEPAGSDRGYDLLASKGGEKIVFEVKDRRRLLDAANEIRRLRTRAQKEGYKFRLIVVNPPREVEIDVAGIETELLRQLQEHVPPELEELSSGTMVQGVSDIEYESLQVDPTGIRVAGSGVVEVGLNYGGGQRR